MPSRHSNVIQRAIQSGTATVTTTASTIGTSGTLPRLTYNIDVHAYQHVGSGLSDITPTIAAFANPKPLVYRIAVSLADATDEFDWYYKESRGPTSDRDPADSGWSLGAAGVAMVGGAMALNAGSTITWAATTGHTLGDEWRFTAKRPELHDGVIVAHYQNLHATNKISWAPHGAVTQDAAVTGGWIIGPEEVLSLNWNKGDLSRILFVGTADTVMRVVEESIG